MILHIGRISSITVQTLVDRPFTVEPADVYQGESNKTFTITFEAKGPMYGSSIVIPIPTQLHPDDR